VPGLEALAVAADVVDGHADHVRHGTAAGLDQALRGTRMT
jgi:hypothetical protein